MSGSVCLLCKNIINSVKYNVDEEYTKYSNLVLRTLLESVFENKVIITSHLYLCVGCVDLLNELDLAENTYNRIRLKVLNYLGYPDNISNNTSNAYCQTDVFLENVLEFDVQGKNKSVGEEAEVADNTVDELNIKIETPPKKFECHICLKKFASKNGTALHIKRQHNTVNSDCNLNNGEKLPEEACIIENTVHSDILVKDEISEHISNLSVSGVEKFEANNSDDTGDNKDEILKLHKGNRGRKKKHPGVLKPYKCTSCPKTWKTLGELKSHLSAHSDARPFICEICGQAYKHKTALDVHVGMHNGIYPFMCTYCNKSFTQKGALQRHLPIHTGETPYQCDLCGKRFVHHTSFNIHQLSHSGQKDYKCAQCGLALLSGSHLKRHMRVHTGERNYICPFCGKRFAERYNLASHQKLHENPGSSTAFKRNHRCQICGTTFNRRLKLDEHMAKDHQKATDSNVPYIQQLFSRNDTESVWSSNYNGVKANMPETSY